MLIELLKKISEYSVYVYEALDNCLFTNKRLNVDLKNIEIKVSHHLNTDARTSKKAEEHVNELGWAVLITASIPQLLALTPEH